MDNTSANEEAANSAQNGYSVIINCSNPNSGVGRLEGQEQWRSGWRLNSSP